MFHTVNKFFPSKTLFDVAQNFSNFARIIFMLSSGSSKNKFGVSALSTPALSEGIVFEQPSKIRSTAGKTNFYTWSHCNVKTFSQSILKPLWREIAKKAQISGTKNVLSDTNFKHILKILF